MLAQNNEYIREASETIYQLTQEETEIIKHQDAVIIQLQNALASLQDEINTLKQ